MKEFSKLTDEEVYKLSTDDIIMYKKLAMAENGIKFPVKPKKPENEKINPDLSVFTIEGISDKWNGLCFEQMEDARDFVMQIAKAKGMGYMKSSGMCGYSTVFFERGLPLNWQNKEPSLNICEERIFSKEKYEKAKKSIKEYNDAIDSYNKKLIEYEEIKKSAEKVTKKIDERVVNVYEDFSKKISLTRIFVHDYLPIAENNEDIAMNFLIRAYSVSEDDMKYILEHKNDEDILSKG